MNVAGTPRSSCDIHAFVVECFDLCLDYTVTGWFIMKKEYVKKSFRWFAQPVEY